MALATAAVVTGTAGAGVGTRSDGAGAAELAAADGWLWWIEPTTVYSGGEREAGALSLVSVEGGTVLHVATELDSAPGPEVRLRAVVIDPSGEREQWVRNPGRWTGGGAVLYRFELGDVERGALIGVELATRTGVLSLAEEARLAAEERGLSVLPFPEVGEEFAFDLRGIGGERASASDYEGKVVLIDCWASWCLPCIDNLPGLKVVYEELRESGLEIVGVNFDFSEQAARRAIEEHGLPWQEIAIVPDPSVMDLWMDASDLRALPRAYVVDRDGILRWDSVGVDIDELERQLRALVAPITSN